MLSLTASICSMSTMDEMCEQMMMSHSSIEMADMGHDAKHADMMHKKDAWSSSDCEMLIDCDCKVENDILAIIAPNALTKINISPVIVSILETITSNQNRYSSKDLNFSIQKSYSPPPLFLANESFLI